MSYDLDHLPIKFEYQNPRLGMLLTIWALNVIFTFGLLAFYNFDLGKFFGLKKILTTIFLIFVIPPVLINAIKHKSNIIIDAAGVHTEVNGFRQNFLWNEIQRVSDLVVDTRSGKKVLQIKRHGELLIDRKSNVIADEFGVDIDELKGLIKAGASRWGSAPHENLV